VLVVTEVKVAEFDELRANLRASVMLELLA
jgi:hypothetical protein